MTVWISTNLQKENLKEQINKIKERALQVSLCKNGLLTPKIIKEGKIKAYNKKLTEIKNLEQSIK